MELRGFQQQFVHSRTHDCLRQGAADKIISPDCTASFAQDGLFGGPQKANSWGDWISDYYDELNQTAHSNIVWSNGALDPWSGGGHYAVPELGVAGEES